MNACKKQIIEFARSNQRVNAKDLATAFGMKPVTSRQYLSALAKSNELVRVGYGVYAIAHKQTFTYKPSAFTCGNLFKNEIRTSVYRFLCL